jgi:mRNA interferase MazF
MGVRLAGRRSVIRSAVYRGQVWLAGLHPVEHVVGHEQAGFRPVLVVSSDQFNAMPSELVMVVPLTTSDRQLVHHIRIEPPERGLLQKTSFALCDQLVTVSTRRLQRPLRMVEDQTLVAVGRALRIFLNLP